MPKVKEAPSSVKEEKPVVVKQPDLSPTIALNILSMLGKPKNMYEIVVKALWDNRYRVNVWCHVEENPTAMFDPKLITDSFFVYSNAVGEIVQCQPEIKKKKYDASNPFARTEKKLKGVMMPD